MLAWYLLYTEILMREMRRDALVHYQLYSQIFSALNDPTEGAAYQALLDLSTAIQTLDFPIIITDPDGIPAHVSNLPFEADPLNPADHPRLYEYARRLATTHEPLVSELGTFYFGNPPVLDRMRWIPWLQVGALGGLVLAAWLMVRHNQRVERERIWATMARESAHQMATPLSSLTGWVEILRLPEEERNAMASLITVTSRAASTGSFAVSPASLSFSSTEEEKNISLTVGSSSDRSWNATTDRTDRSPLRCGTMRGSPASKTAATVYVAAKPYRNHCRM